MFGVDLDAADASQRRAIERRWGILFQQGALFSSLTVRQNIQLHWLTIESLPEVVDALDAIGGQCTALYPEKPIFDIPGYPRIDANVLVERLAEQAAPFAPVYHFGQRVTAFR